MKTKFYHAEEFTADATYKCDIFIGDESDELTTCTEETMKRFNLMVTSWLANKTIVILLSATPYFDYKANTET